MSIHAPYRPRCPSHPPQVSVLATVELGGRKWCPACVRAMAKNLAALKVRGSVSPLSVRP